VRASYLFSELLKQFRVRGGMSQQQLGERVGVHRNTISAWERGDALPKTKGMVMDLANALYLEEQDTDDLLKASLWAAGGHHRDSFHPSILWNLPFQRNPFFTGREQILNRIHEMLKGNKTIALVQPPALHGLGGIGKTQTVVEYAFRHYEEYQAILWASAASVSDLLVH